MYHLRFAYAEAKIVQTNTD